MRWTGKLLVAIFGDGAQIWKARGAGHGRPRLWAAAPCHGSRLVGDGGTIVLVTPSSSSRVIGASTNGGFYLVVSDAQHGVRQHPVHGCTGDPGREAGGLRPSRHQIWRIQMGRGGGAGPRWCGEVWWPRHGCLPTNGCGLGCSAFLPSPIDGVRVQWSWHWGGLALLAGRRPWWWQPRAELTGQVQGGCHGHVGGVVAGARHSVRVMRHVSSWLFAPHFIGGEFLLGSILVWLWPSQRRQRPWASLPS